MSPLELLIRRVSHALILAAMLFFIPPAYTNERAPTVNPAVVSVTSPFGACSGFVAEQGKVITAAHCIPVNGAAYVLTFYDGVQAMGTNTYTDNDDDWAVIEYDELAYKYPDVPMSPVMPGSGAPVDHYRSIVYDGMQIISPGTFQDKICELDEKKIKHCYVYFQGIVIHGDSGGPLFNNRGEVIGIVVMTMWPNLPVGIATPVDEAFEWIRFN